ncbi:MAG: peptidylprolyl isomerase [Rhodospirillales bacterium]|nr:peptidylprolyl isomerase [Rhodospirillales bacterium]MDE2576715.1 peptidylprolyl isomerase [Rhodospirillales bacterium]
MRTLRLSAALLAACLPLSVAAQTAAPAAPTPTPSAPAATAPTAAPPAGLPADPVVGKVDDQEIHLSDIAEAAQALPDQYRRLPQTVLFPLLLNQAIDRQAVLVLARKQGLDKDPAVIRQMHAAQDDALQNALISHDVSPMADEAAIKARYEKDFANKPGEEEVQARHILVKTRPEAEAIIAQLKKGADFAALAKAHSTDPGGAEGGELGFFKKGDMVPAFSAAAFALKPGEYTQVPVQTQFGWHVIKVEARRAAPPATLAEKHDEIRQVLIKEGIQKVLEEARAGVTVQKFNADGTVPHPTDTAVPPPPPAKK